MTLLYRDEKFRLHDTGNHPENRRRLEAIDALLDKSGLPERCRSIACTPCDPATAALNHERDYIDQVAEYAAAGGGRIEADTIVSPRSYDIALLAAGSACDAVKRVVAGEEKTALCLVRPPGHHAVEQAAMGFCLFNNVAIAAQFARKRLDLDRVLIIDWDVHHGNGTQDAFYRDGQVGFFSSHRFPFYPGTGDKDETGAGPGLGGTRNLPFAMGVSRKDFLARFESELVDFAGKIRPQLVLLSAGFDAHRQDPVGSLGLETEDFGELTRIVRGVASEHAGGKLVSLLEGGYNPDRLADCVALHLQGLLAG
ncbi:histone deacetylase family protein [Lignipirellula cremea]|uniref:Histone deacetylase-like amidohydrolase n=1 Tax=Lignipirellula cremea TaxID=2528010 RepID=A0A518DP21_9BACT|nr:histone deacetylase [Lignipirellula cremea]QDU93584.1 Histone deacetylase-like amidohydrolase [Lignipirellula cremea]